ncbi:MAG: hypothetical protein C4K58_04045 [Flavobacteriaceae bacterium]|nr:MAG: hypothetical protein C4K58_04045 [Flavobacteriaceae bacterium]
MKINKATLTFGVIGLCATLSSFQKSLVESHDSVVVSNAIMNDEIPADVKVILDQKCTSCHGEAKQKGGLRLDSMESILKGGESGPAVEFGNAKSILLTSIHSPLESDEHMPPASKPQLTEEEISTINKWICGDSLAK